jgi:hypothetical protein
LHAWLLKKYGAASSLAAALGVTRQTAHNFLTGRTIPSYENCEKLGLLPVFLLREKEGTMEMSNLDDYLARREQDRRHGGPMSEAQLNAVLLSERGASMWKEVREATRGTAPRVGAIDGIPLEWDDGQVAGPLLRLRPVGAQFKQVKSAPSGGSLRGYRVVFGWVTTDSGTETRALPNRVWNLTLSCNEGALTWDVNRDEIIGASSIELAEQIVKQLVEFRDEYMLKAYGKISN